LFSTTAYSGKPIKENIMPRLAPPSGHHIKHKGKKPSALLQRAFINPHGAIWVHL